MSDSRCLLSTGRTDASANSAMLEVTSRANTRPPVCPLFVYYLLVTGEGVFVWLPAIKGAGCPGKKRKVKEAVLPATRYQQRWAKIGPLPLVIYVRDLFSSRLSIISWESDHFSILHPSTYSNYCGEPSPLLVAFSWMFTLIHVSPHSLIASYPITRYWLPLWGFESGKCSMARDQSVGTKKENRQYLTFRSGSKLFCQAADCSVAHQTFRSRIKLSGRASNFSVRLCSLYNLPQAANVLQVPSVGISTIPTFYLIIISTIHQIYCNVHYYVLFYIQIEIACEPRRGPILMLAPLSS